MTRAVVLIQPGFGAGLRLTLPIAVSVACGLLLASTSPSVVVALVVLPAIVVLAFAYRRHTFVLLVPTLGLTALFGRDFAHVSIGPAYVLDITLLAAMALSAPEIMTVARRAPVPSLALGGLLFLTLTKLALDGVSGESVRHSVIGIYALWALVGFAIVRVGLTQRVGRAIVWGGALTVVLYGLVLVHPANPFTLHVTPRYIGGAGGLYVAYFLFSAVFAPSLWPRRNVLFVALAAIGVVELAAGEVRSLWLAVPAAIALTVVFLRTETALTGRLAVGVGVLAAALAAATLIFPSTVQPLNTEAASIYNYAGTSASDANARWRIDTAAVALNRFRKHPAAGVNLAEPGAYVTQSDGTLRTTDLHNSFVALLLHLGILGAACVAVFQIAVLRSARFLTSGTQAGAMHGIAAWLLACQLLTGVHALFTVVLQVPYLGLFYWLFGGVLIALATLARGAVPSTPA